MNNEQVITDLQATIARLQAFRDALTANAARTQQSIDALNALVAQLQGVPAP